ncbi:hypothetical protein TWF281_001091 [Arthrobotrys megalospora]
MRLISKFWLVAAIALPHFTPLVSGLVIPRRAHPREVALYEPIAPIQAPLYSYHKQAHRSSNLSIRDEVDGTIRKINETSNNYIQQNVTFLDGVLYYLPAKIGDQQFDLIIDTGSSDTWVIESDYVCFTMDGKFSPNRYCNFGPEFDHESSSSFQYLNQTNGSFAVVYADRSYAKGFVGQDILNVSGIAVNQTIGVASIARWQGDGLTSGILGLGYPGSIPSTPGHQPYDWVTKDGNGDVSRGPSLARQQLNFDCHDSYPSFIQSLAEQGHEPLFSISLLETRPDRGGVHGKRPWPPQGGFIAFGGIPYVPHLGLPFAKAKMNPDVNESTCASDVRQIGYGFDIDAITDGDEIIFAEKRSAKLDTGASAMVFPFWLFQQFWSRVDPMPSFRDLKGGLWKIKCNATMPDLGFVIGGVVIKVDRSQLIRAPVIDFMDEIEDMEEMCIMNIMTNLWSDEVILGIPFLQGVLAVYDLGNKEIRIAKKFSPDPSHIPVWMDKVSTKLIDHPPPGAKTSSSSWTFGNTSIGTATSTSINVLTASGDQSTSTTAASSTEGYW